METDVSSRRVRALGRPVSAAFVVVLLLAAGWLAAGSAQGQSIQFFAGIDTYDYGWTFPEGTFAGTTVEDSPTDQALSLSGAAEAPASALPVYDAGELVALTIDEPNDELLRIQIQVGDIDPQNYNTVNLAHRMTYEVFFTIGGHGYLARGILLPACEEGQSAICEPLTGDRVSLFATLFRSEDDGGLDALGYLPTQVLVDADTVEMLVPRYALDRSGEGQYPLAGDALTLVRAQSRIGISIFGGIEGGYRFQDAIPDQGTVEDFHTLEVQTAGSLVAVGGEEIEISSGDDFDDDFDFSGPEPFFPRRLAFDVDTSDSGSIPIVLENHMDRKTLVVPTVEVLSSHAGLAFDLPESVAIPAGETRHMALQINGTWQFPADDPLVVSVGLSTLGTSQTFGDHITIDVRSMPGLDPAANRLYLHTTQSGGFWMDGVPVDSFRFLTGYLNTMAQDPADSGYPVTMTDGCLCNNQVWAGWDMDALLVDDVHLDTDEMAFFHIQLESPHDGSLEIEAALQYGDSLVAYGAEEYDVTTGTNTIDIPMWLDDHADVLEGGVEPFYFDIRPLFRPADVPLSEFTTIVDVAAPKMQTNGLTWIELPVIEAPERVATIDHLIVDLARGYDAVQYVNPGLGTLWNVTIFNQGDANDTVTVDALSAAGWQTTIAPGTTFRIAPGSSVAVGVRAVAPVDSVEGDSTRVNITVSSARAGDAENVLGVAAVVTAGVDIEEQEFHADNVTQNSLRSSVKEKGSPGVPSLLLVGALAGLLGVARRRRQ